MKRKLSCVVLLIVGLLPFLFTACVDEEPLPEEGSIVVLMYHVIRQGEPSNLYERSASEFENDLEYLISNNIRVLSFNDLLIIRESGKMPSGHSAIICFDDGDKSCYDLALPLLRQYMMKATFFIWVEKVGQLNYMSGSEISTMSRFMLNGGARLFSFGSHSYTHPFLLGRKPDFPTDEEYQAFLDYEMGESRRVIESLTEIEVNTFALPFGDGAGDPDIIEAAVRNGYNMIRTSVNSAIHTGDFSLLNIPALPMLDNTEQEEILFYLEN
ncbi:MAG: polysaccharide deacetylase family protein [Bacteroidales bacterium]|nr:polysaccharide deacetylase family protein [Bacteroidales bacterium]